jgi:diguanylate cyclase (GGDEF)-like protein
MGLTAALIGGLSAAIFQSPSRAVLAVCFALTVAGLLGGLRLYWLPPRPVLVVSKEPAAPAEGSHEDLQTEIARLREGRRIEMLNLTAEIGKARNARQVEIDKLTADLHSARAALGGGSHQLAEELRRTLAALEEERGTRRRQENDLRLLAEHDTLTGLPSRRVFADRLSVAIAQAGRLQRQVALFLLGLDSFGEINERYGASVGNDLLRSVGLLIERSIRQGDTVTRLEADRFAIQLPGLAHGEDVRIITEKLRLALRGPLSIGGHDISLSASIGVAIYPEDGPDFDTLLRSAAVAMQRVKERGGDGYDIHAPATRARTAERVAIEHALRRALTNGNLALRFHPIADCETGLVISAGTVLYWRHSDVQHGHEWRPLTENTLLAVPLGQWTLLQACRQAQQWRRDGHADFTIAVPLTIRQFHHPSLTNLIRHALEETGLPPAALELDILEIDLLQNPNVAIDHMVDLKALGVRLAIAGFGAGDAVLAQLARFPVDALKLDSSIVREIQSDRNHEGVVSAAITLALARKLQVTACGVDHEAQRIMLLGWRCDRIQGRLCGDILASEDLAMLLERQMKSKDDLDHSLDGSDELGLVL